MKNVTIEHDLRVIKTGNYFLIPLVHVNALVRINLSPSESFRRRYK